MLSTLNSELRFCALKQLFVTAAVISLETTLLSALPLATGKVAPAAAVPTFMLIAGLAYTLAGVHLIRPLLWSGLMMLAAYAALQLLPLPYIWTISGIAIALSLVWAGIVARQARHAGNAQ